MPLDLLWVFFAGIAGGAVNSIAGGGTLLTFPALVGVGIPPIIANASNTVALTPGAFSSMWGYRAELGGIRPWLIGLAGPSLVGGLVGALLLLITPSDRFDAIVPWLVFGATALFMAQRPVMAWNKRRQEAGGRSQEAGEPTRPNAPMVVYQLLVAVYGGYFGAGIGILMLAALGFMGFTNIHRMNGLKNFLAIAINGTAAVTFIIKDVVDWPIVIATGIGAVIGGYVGSRVAQRVPQERVRQAIGLVGISAGVWLLAK